MTKKAGDQTLADRFAESGRGLRIPPVDLSAVVEHHRRDLGALRRSFERVARDTGEIAVIVQKSGAGPTAILRTRIQSSMEEIRKVVEKGRGSW